MNEKRRCIVKAIGKQSVFGTTTDDDHEEVVMLKCAEGLIGVQRGDLVEFEPSKFRGGDPSTWRRPIKWFGTFPFIVARNVAETTTGPGTRPCTDGEAFSEAFK